MLPPNPSAVRPDEETGAGAHSKTEEEILMRKGTAVDSGAEISPEEVRFDFVRASGPGGQNVNKVATAVQLRFNARNQVDQSEVAERLIRLAGKRANSSGEIIIEAKRYRTQQRNRRRHG